MGLIHLRYIPFATIERRRRIIEWKDVKMAPCLTLSSNSVGLYKEFDNQLHPMMCSTSDSYNGGIVGSYEYPFVYCLQPQKKKLETRKS